MSACESARERASERARARARARVSVCVCWGGGDELCFREQASPISSYLFSLITNMYVGGSIFLFLFIVSVLLALPLYFA